MSDVNLWIFMSCLLIDYIIGRGLNIIILLDGIHEKIIKSGLNNNFSLIFKKNKKWNFEENYNLF